MLERHSANTEAAGDKQPRDRDPYRMSYNNSFCLCTTATKMLEFTANLFVFNVVQRAYSILRYTNPVLTVSIGDTGLRLWSP